MIHTFLLSALLLTPHTGGLDGVTSAVFLQEQGKPDAEARLLPLGKVSPDFTLPQVTGGEVTLGTLLKLSKAVVVHFYGKDAEVGGGDLGPLQKLYAELEARGLSVVSINPRDDLEEIKKHAEKAGVNYPVAIDGKETNRAVTNVYKARNLSTVYLLDPDGKVVYRSVGLKEAALREAIVKLGVK